MKKKNRLCKINYIFKRIYYILKYISKNIFIIKFELIKNHKFLNYFL